ncbi:ERF family protein [Rhodococcus sp. IEGM 1351]|uniref:ERF family protein n=1 Tax=Rhodococcus sp. IEGM 1351 TaxID=3047089 RepID=UPI0024B6ACEA|nr:ERF family protein [Rhodococcus sp. IEGM 1351]MDI9934724.1 ERF family protein [Rhodococcus sp. IEGM 1351]
MESEKTIHSRLRAVQTELNAPKSQRNDFGNYDYRSAEDILEAVKPLLKQHELTLVVADDIDMIGDRYYVKATARVYDDKNNFMEVTAYAREAADKKGMDAAQVTGATSSYARKYALNGLFAIDDSKDADSNEHTAQRKSTPGPKPKASPNKPASDAQLNLLRTLMNRAGISADAISAGIAKIHTSAEASDAIEKMQAKLAEKDAA